MAHALEEQVLRAFPATLPERLGVAVSGGGDSVALLHLLTRLKEHHKVHLRAVTVDHNLRPDAAAEALHVGAFCRDLGVDHQILDWHDWDGKGNLQNEARDARYRLMAAWARQNDLRMIALGHTADDQAETVLMRLARRSGVDGLSGMAVRHVAHEVDWIRPLLGIARQDLRDYLSAAGIRWVEDPSNEDLRFDRIKARRALVELSGLGIDVDALTTVAQNMAEARKALNWQAFLAARATGCVDAGAVVYSARKLRTQPDEIQRRLLVHAIGWVSGNSYPPRRDAIATVRKALAESKGSTLDGCQIVVREGQIWIFREYRAVEGLRTPVAEVWDNRWRLYSRDDGLDLKGLEVRALGLHGLGQVVDWRKTSRPRAMLLGCPAVWRGDDLVAAPASSADDTWRAELDCGEEAFFAGLLSH